MKTKLIFLLTLFLAATHTSMAFQEKKDHEILFEKAMYTMETKADLNEAIILFESLITTYPEEKEYAAKAQYHIGLCYEKLGLKEAQKAYQKVLDNYPYQTKEISQAKERLNRILALQDTPHKPNFKKIRIPTKLSWNLALSPDGQKLLLVSDQKLWVMPLSGNLGTDIPGKPVELNTEGIKVEWTGISWSSDGNWVAFNELSLQDTLLQKDGYQSIYVVPVEGGTPQKIYENYRSARTVNYKLSLSPQGKTLIFSSIENEKQHIQTISVDGGNPQQLTDIQSREPVFSPDGKLIAFVEDKLSGLGGGSLWVMPASGGPPTLVVQAGKASSPVWSPDGSNIAYVDFNDSKKIFIVPVDEEGKPSGNRITINAPEGFEEVPLIAGWDPDNKIGALMVSQVEYALYTLPEQGGQAAQVVKGVRPAQPRWTPDGKHIQFLKLAGEESLPPNNVLALVPAEGGEERDILSGLEDSLFIMGFQSGLGISPDGNKILMATSHWGDMVVVNNFPLSQIWTTTREGDDPIQITHPQVLYTDICPSWLPDGKSIVFLRTKIMEGQMDMFGEQSIYTIKASGEELKLLITLPDKWTISINCSPDGKWIAYLTTEKQPPYESMLSVLNMESGESRGVSKVQRASAHTELTWSPDSKRIAWNDGDGKKIKIMQIEDGTIEDIETGLVDTKIYHLDWSPDGKRFVFGGWKGGGREFWWVENFLPGSNPKK